MNVTFSRIDYRRSLARSLSRFQGIMARSRVVHGVNGCKALGNRPCSTPTSLSIWSSISPARHSSHSKGLSTVPLGPLSQSPSQSRSFREALSQLWEHKNVNLRALG